MRKNIELFFRGEFPKVQSVGLQNRYQNDHELSLHVRMILPLAFVPPEDAVKAFEMLSKRIREDPDFQLHYGTCQYVHKWNC